MAQYRLHFMNSDSGRIAGAADIHASDDQEAIQAAHGFLQDQSIEIWRGPLEVARIDAQSQAF